MFSSESLIKAHGLTKKFGSFTAVDHIDFEVYVVYCRETAELLSQAVRFNETL